MELQLNKKLHRYLVQNALMLEIKAVQDTTDGVKTKSTGNKYTFITPNPYSLKDAEITSTDSVANETYKNTQGTPYIVRELLEFLDKKGTREKLKKKRFAFVYICAIKIKVTLTPLSRVF